MHLYDHALSGLFVIPFIGVLGSIALFPLIALHFWENHYGKISLFWAVSALIPLVLMYGGGLTAYEFVHLAIADYFPFVILLMTLFTISGGISFSNSLTGQTWSNLKLLIIGSLLASWVGTTGAAMVLIRPLIRANAWRKYTAHTVVFFIFLVANIGGCLTPLGDPPLFLGFLNGVDFFWTLTHLFKPMMVAGVILLILYWIIDSYFYRKEDGGPPEMPAQWSEFRIHGKRNIFLLALAVLAVLMSGTWKSGISFDVYGTALKLESFARDIILLSLSGLSIAITPKAIREENDFNWEPMKEVAKLFAGIFTTMIPILAMLKAKHPPFVAHLIDILYDKTGTPIDGIVFWVTGLHSSFLDNAPSYLIFFEAVGGDPVVLMGQMASTLTAISLGAVFMGANTYIGNGPNFMVKSIAQSMGIPMPSFFGYIFKYTITILVPVFILVTWLFFP